jgi:hypothetical protein
MHFRGGGIGHTSTRAETDVFKTDRDNLDIKSRQDRKDALHTEDEDSCDEEMNRSDIDIDMIIEGAAEGDGEVGKELDQDGELLISELMDYGYEPEIETDEESDNEEEEDREAGEEEDY